MKKYSTADFDAARFPGGNVVSLDRYRMNRNARQDPEPSEFADTHDRSVVASGSDSNRRIHDRITRHERLFAQIVECRDEPAKVGQTFDSRILDLSCGGLRLQTWAALPADSVLDLWVDIASRSGKFFLAGDVRWCRPYSDQQGDEQWCSGIELRESVSTDILAWLQYHTGNRP